VTSAHIRLATDADVDALLALWAAADAVPSVTDDVRSVRAAIALDAMLVAEVDGTVIGSVIAAFDGWRGNMYRLAVHPDHRRRGIAAQLVTEGERRLAAAGSCRITALVVAEHDHATAFWRAVGYEHDERITRFVKTTATAG